MENEVLRDIILVIAVLTVFVLGFFVMKRLDKFLNENCKPHYIDEESPTLIIRNGDVSDEEILSNIKKVREKGGKIKVVIYNEDNFCD